MPPQSCSALCNSQRMPLTPFQKEVLKVLVSNRSEQSHVAGGLVLNAPENSSRYSRDFDFFHEAVEDLVIASEQDVRSLEESGFHVQKVERDNEWSKPVSFREPLIKSHRGRCGKNGPRARRLRGRIPAVGCNREANTAPGLLSPQPGGLKPFVDFCCVARSGETAAGIAQHSRLQKSANALKRPSWD